MRAVDGSIVIERPVEEVFDFVADERNEPRYNRRMRRADLVSTGPVHAGSHFRAEIGGLRRPIQLEVDLIGYVRPSRLAAASHAKAIDTFGALTFDPVPEGTKLTWHWELDPHPPWSILGPLVVPIGRAQERRIWEGLKELLEEGGPAHVEEAARPPEPARRRMLSLCAAAVAASAYAGAFRLATGRHDPRLAALREQLPLESMPVAASALTAVVAVPFTVLSALAWDGDRRSARAAVGAGGLLLGWLLAQRLLIRQTSWLQPLYGGIALCVVIAGDPRRRVQRWAVRHRRPARTRPAGT